MAVYHKCQKKLLWLASLGFPKYQMSYKVCHTFLSTFKPKVLFLRLSVNSGILISSDESKVLPLVLHLGNKRGNQFFDGEMRLARHSIHSVVLLAVWLILALFHNML